MAENKKLEISFGGCGFLGVYHAGVGQAVCDKAPQLFNQFTRFYGASAGAITAVWAACKRDPMEAYKWVKKTFESSRAHSLGMFTPGFKLYSRLEEFLESCLPRDAHRQCRGKVWISLTYCSNGKLVNWLVTDFNTRRELINAVIASSFIPGYAGLRDLPVFRGRRCFDGGFSSNVPYSSQPDVITVSPFSGSCDISPHEASYPCTITLCDQALQLTPTNLHRLAKSLCPTQWEELEDLFQLGYSDATSFFTRQGFFPATPPDFPFPVTPTTDLSMPSSPTRTEYFSMASYSREPSIDPGADSGIDPGADSGIDSGDEPPVNEDSSCILVRRSVQVLTCPVSMAVASVSRLSQVSSVIRHKLKPPSVVSQTLSLVSKLSTISF